MSILQAIRDRLAPPRPQQGIVIEYYACSSGGGIMQRECVLLAVPGKLTITAANGDRQVFEIRGAP